MLRSIVFALATGIALAKFETHYHADGSRADEASVETEMPTSCDLAVVGAGWGGAYLAWRMAIDDGSLVNASGVCVFEANSRVGGRIYSVRTLPGFDDLALDVGGYRFIETDLLPAQLVWDALKLPTTCYDWECAGGCEGDGNCYIIKDAYGNNAGYATAIETMLGQLEGAGDGAQVHFGKQLTAVGAGKGRGVELRFADGSRVSAGRLLLNMPANAIEGLDEDSVIFKDAPKATCEALDDVTVGGMNKVYAFYDDAWWNSKLGIMEGTFDDTKLGSAPFKGRYHDGPQKCVVGATPAGEPVYSGQKVERGNCSGALEVYYSSRTDYYTKFTSASPELEALAVFEADSDDPLAAELLGDIHDHLLAYHADMLSEAGVDPASLPTPRVVTVSNWIPDAPITPGIGSFKGTDKDRAKVRAPTPDYEIYVADQDYGYRSGWAVGSLKMAEKILQAELGLPKPTWLDETWYKENVVDLV